MAFLSLILHIQHQIPSGPTRHGILLLTAPHTCDLSSSSPQLWAAPPPAHCLCSGSLQSPPTRLPAPGFPHHCQSILHRGSHCDFPKQTRNLIISIYTFKRNCSLLILPCTTLSSLFRPYFSNLISCIGVGGGKKVVSLSVVLT